MTRRKLFEVLENFELLTPFQNGKISLNCDGALATMFSDNQLINSMIGRCALHGSSNISRVLTKKLFLRLPDGHF